MCSTKFQIVNMESLMNPQFFVERTVYTNKNIVSIFLTQLCMAFMFCPWYWGLVLRNATCKMKNKPVIYPCHISKHHLGSNFSMNLTDSLDSGFECWDNNLWCVHFWLNFPKMTNFSTKNDFSVHKFIIMKVPNVNKVIIILW